MSERNKLVNDLMSIRNELNRHPTRELERLREMTPRSDKRE